MNILNYYNKKSFKVLAVALILDCIFGILRAIKQRKLNSTIGIEGIIRKCAMIFSVIGIEIVDLILDINFIGFLPESVLEFLNLSSIGLADLFGILFIIFEFLSILKNMYLCGLPIPKNFKSWLEKVLKEFTKEI